jgi:hypothetical protein
MIDDPYPTRDSQVFLGLARDRLSVQLETLDALDTKIAMLFSTSTALLGILAAVLALKAGHFNGWDYAGVLASLAAYVFAAVESWRAYRVREWKVGPELHSVWRLYSEAAENESDAQLGWIVGNKLRLHYEANQADVTQKIDALRLVGPAVFIQTLILVLTLVLVA